MTRQREWQLRQRAAGLCHACTEPVFMGGVYCQEHLLAYRKRNRRKGGWKAWKPGGLGRPPLDREKY